MNKVLIISYYWPPAGGPGSQRIVKLAKYLPDFGWEPVILTVKDGEYPYLDNSLQSDIDPGLKIYKTKSFEPFSLYKKISGVDSSSPLPVGQLTDRATSLKGKIFQWIRTNLFIPDGRVGWIPSAYKEAKKIIKQEDIKIVFCSSPPHSLQVVGQRLKKKLGIPLVADFRDPWTKIQYYQRSRRIRLAQKIDEKLELKVLKQLNHLTTVSSTVADSFVKRLPASEEKLAFSILTNGWDPDDFQSIQHYKASDFLILHTGNLNATQVPDVLFQSLQKLGNERSEGLSTIKIKFIGRVHQKIMDAVSHYHLELITEFQPFMSHQSVIEEICNASLLFSVVPDVPDNKGIVMSKNFEYIGTGNPILVIGPKDSDIARILSEFANSNIFDYHDVEGCKRFIGDSITKFNRSKTVTTPDSLRKKYSRVTIARKLSEILEHCTQ